MSETPISEREIEFAMAMFAATNPARFEHLCKAIRTLERELNEAKRLLAIPRPQNNIIAMERNRDEWKSCAEELADRLIKAVCSSDDESWKAVATFNQLKEKSKCQQQ